MKYLNKNLILVCVLWLLGLSFLSCASSPIGHIVRGEQQPGRVVVSAQGGAGGNITDEGVGVGGAVHVDPFVTSRLSIPVSLSYLRLWDAESLWSATGRVGLRYRLGEYITLGGGLAAVVQQSDDTERKTFTNGSGQIDFEWSVGRRWSFVSISWAQRLLWDARNYFFVNLLSELSLAWYPTGKDLAITASPFYSITFPYFIMSGGGIVGIAYEF